MTMSHSGRQTWTGARQTWRRKPSEPARVLAWELADGEPTRN
jgi:hypothetical protein